ncbi:hypothetical protein S83_018647 [Arachis hypogaea]|nr:uncharacterized protein DS421_14g468970 [Arachis hypogaea]
MEPANRIRRQSCKFPTGFKKDFMKQSTAVISLLRSLLELEPCSFNSASRCSSAHAVLKLLLYSAVVPCSVLSGKSITLRRSPLSLKPLASYSILRGT